MDPCIDFNFFIQLELTTEKDAAEEEEIQLNESTECEYLEEPKEERSLLKTTSKTIARPKKHICPECGHKVESPSKLKSHILARHRFSVSH
jgi:hypothetical protein